MCNRPRRDAPAQFQCPPHTANSARSTSPHASAAAAATPMAANTACAPVNHDVGSVGRPPFTPSFSSTSAITPAISITKRRPHRKRVVFLIRRNRKEDQRPRREQAQQPDRPGAELDPPHVAAHILAHGVVQIKIHRVACIVPKMLQPCTPRLPGHRSQRARKRLHGKIQISSPSQYQSAGILL